MEKLKLTVKIIAFMVFAICAYTFFLGNESFEGKFANDGMAWYFLAKGLFCAAALYLLVLILEQLSNKK